MLMWEGVHTILSARSTKWKGASEATLSFLVRSNSHRFLLRQRGDPAYGPKRDVQRSSELVPIPKMTGDSALRNRFRLREYRKSKSERRGAKWCAQSH